MQRAGHVYRMHTGHICRMHITGHLQDAMGQDTPAG